MSNSQQYVKAFLDSDLEKVGALIEKNPNNIPIKAVADFLGKDVYSIRAAVECGAFGFAWLKAEKMNKAYCIPTAQFVRWYLNVDVLSGFVKNLPVR